VLALSWYQLLLLATIFAVPLFLMMKRDGDGLLLWLIAVICTDVFNGRTGVNVSAASVAGLLLMPYSARILLHFKKAPPIGWVSAHFAYLVVLGLVFGFGFPWHDTIGRPLNLQAQGRTVLYLMREAAGFSIAVFIAQQVAKAGRPDRVLTAILVAAFVTCAFAVLEYVTGISWYLLFNEGVRAPTYWNLRVRGLNFEPRGLGTIAAHAFVIGTLCIAYRRHIRLAAGTFASGAAAIFFSASTSGLIAAAAGLGAVSMAHRRIRRRLLRSAVPIVLVGAAVVWANWNRVAALQHLLSVRVGSTVRYGPASTWFQEIAYRLEVFDTVAALFLAANPVYWLIGTGPGLISIPATPLLPITPYTVVYIGPGVNSPPTMGIVLELANGGLIALILWIGFVLSAARALRWASQQPGPDQPSWFVARWSFVGAAAVYLMAAGFLSSCWPLFIGLGLGAAFMRQQSSPLAAQTLAEPVEVRP
jgi:hypothetical protein